MQKPLGKNKGGYFGETIDVRSILEKISLAAKERGWEKEVFHRNDSFDFFGLKRKRKEDGLNIYISAGIHGDEPAGPLSALRLLEEDQWDENLNIWLCPCLNPTGFTFNSREDEKGADLNRDYRILETPETKAHVSWLEDQPDFDLSLCLHEDWEAKGFYVYIQKEDDCHIAEKVLKAVSATFPIDYSLKIDGFKATDGMVNPNIDIDKCREWREAFYLAKKKKGLHYTFETSSDFPLEARVEALVVAVKAAIENLAE